MRAALLRQPLGCRVPRMEAFLRTHERLGAGPLVSPSRSSGGAAIRAAATVAHQGARRLFGSNVLPSGVRRVASFVDKRVHPRVCSGDTVDVFHCSPSAPLPALAAGRRPQRFLTVWDLAFTRFPQLYGAPYRRYLRAALQSLQPGDNVITTSRFVRDEVLAEGIAPADRVHVVPLAADRKIFYPCEDPRRIAAVRSRYSIPEGPYVLGVNTPDVRKNVPHVIRAFAQAASDGGPAVGSRCSPGTTGPDPRKYGVRLTSIRHSATGSFSPASSLTRTSRRCTRARTSSSTAHLRGVRAATTRGDAMRHAGDHLRYIRDARGGWRCRCDAAPR